MEAYPGIAPGHDVGSTQIPRYRHVIIGVLPGIERCPRTGVKVPTIEIIIYDFNSAFSGWHTNLMTILKFHYLSLIVQLPG